MFPKFFDVQKYFWASENSFGRPNRCLDVQSSFCNAPILSDANTIFWTSSDTCMMPGKVSSQDVTVLSYRWKALSGSVTGSQIAIRAITLVQNKYGCNCFAHFLSLFFPLCLLLAFSFFCFSDHFKIKFYFFFPDALSPDDYFVLVWNPEAKNASLQSHYKWENKGFCTIIV